jgi:hypothetical protein
VHLFDGGCWMEGFLSSLIGGGEDGLELGDYGLGGVEGLVVKSSMCWEIFIRGSIVSGS